MDCKRRKYIEVVSPAAKLILSSTLICVMVLLLGCSDKTPASKTYERTYFVDWGHGFQEALGEVEVNGKWGFINSSGQIVIKPKFNQVFRGFTEGIALVRRGAIIEPKTRDAGELGRLVGKCAFIDRQGRTIWEYPTLAQPFSEGLAAVCVGGRWGILSEAFGAEAKWGFINKKGEFVIPAKYMRVGSFSEGLAGFRVAAWKCGYINAKGEVVIESNYVSGFGFSEGLAAVYKEEGWGFINKEGKVVIPPQYESARSFHEGLAAVSVKDKRNEKWGFINKNGDVVIPLQYDYAVGFREQLAAVKKNDKWGYINARGDIVIPFRFDDAEAFSEGLAQVKIGDKWGYIDKKGEFIIEPKFYLTSPFTEGFAKVAVGDKLGYIDKQGKYIWEPTR